MFESYRNRLGYFGKTDQEAVSTQNRMIKEVAFDFTQSYQEVIVEDKKYDARLIQDVNDTIKTGNGNFVIEFRSGIIFYPGTYVQIKNPFGVYEYWIIFDVLDNLGFTTSLIKKCAHELRWKNNKGEIVSRWVAFDDSYKIYDGIRNYAYNTNLPEASIVVWLPADEETINIRRDRRFLLDAESLDEPPDAYAVSNRNVVSNLIEENGKIHGIVTLSLDQEQFNFKTDNAELMVADYYTDTDDNTESTDITGVEIYAKIEYDGKNRIVAGTPHKTYTIRYYDESGNEVNGIDTVWEVKILPEFEQFFDIQTEGNTIRIAAEFNENILNYKFKIVGSNQTNDVSAELQVKVVSGI